MKKESAELKQRQTLFKQIHLPVINEWNAILSVKSISLLHCCPGFDPVPSYTISQRHSKCHNQPRPNTSIPSLCVLISSVCQINCPYGLCDISQSGWMVEGIRLLNSQPSQCLKPWFGTDFHPNTQPNQLLNLMEKSEPWIVILMEEGTRGWWGVMEEEVSTVWPSQGGSETLKSVRLTIKGRFNRLPKRLAPCL